MNLTTSRQPHRSHRAASTAIEVVEDLLAGATDALVRASGETSLCSSAKSGILVPSVKYAEGQRAALNTLRRELQAPGQGTQAAAAAIATRSATAWRDECARLQERSAGADWIAYRTGGAEALERVAQLLGEAGTGFQ